MARTFRTDITNHSATASRGPETDPWVEVPADDRRGYTVTKTDIKKVKGWREIVKTGGNASTIPYDCTVREFKTSTKAKGRPWVRDNDVNAHQEKLYRGMTPLLLYSDIYNPVFWTSDLDRARVKAYVRFTQALREKRRKMAGMVFLAEFREVCRLIRKPATAIDKALRRYIGDVWRIRRGRRQLDLRIWDDIHHKVADAWLELSFAVKPLVADSISIAESIASWREDRLSPLVRGSAGDHVVSNISGPDIQMASGTPWIFGGYRGSETRTWRYTVYGRLRASAELPAKGSAERLRQVLGFNLEEFVPTMWEIIPFSFVVDYFANVGEMLSLHTTDLSWVDWVNQSEQLDFLGQPYFSLFPKVQAAREYKRIGDTMFGSARFHYRKTRRTAATFSDLPLQFNLPGSPNQYANLGALLVKMSGPMSARGP